MTAEFMILRFVHIVGGTFWVGSALFSTVFLVPALAKSGPGAGAVFAELQRRRLFTVLPAVAILTLLSGLRLLAIVSNAFAAPYFGTRVGQTFAAAGVAAIIAFLLGMFVSRPATVRIAQLSASLASAPKPQRAALSAEIAALRRRSDAASVVAVALLILGAGGMSVARYL